MINKIEKLWGKWCEERGFNANSTYNYTQLHLGVCENHSNGLVIDKSNTKTVGVKSYHEFEGIKTVYNIENIKLQKLVLEFHQLVQTMQEVEKFDSVEEWLESEFKKINNRVSIKFTDDSMTVIYKYLDNDVDEFEFYKDDILSNIIDIIKYMSSDVDKIEKLISLVKTYKYLKEVCDE